MTTPRAVGPWGVLVAGAMLLCVLAVPLFSVLVPPMGDYPNHLARMHILAAIGSSAELQANYVTQWLPSPYLAMDVLVPALTRVMSVYSAGRVFIFLAFALQIAGTVLLFRFLAGRWSVWPLAGTLAMFGYVVHLGFVNYVFGVGVAMVAFALWVGMSQQPTWARIAASMAAAMAVYAAHYFAFLAYGLAVACWELQAWIIARNFSVRETARRGVVAGAQIVSPLALFHSLGDRVEAGGTAYGSWTEQTRALLAPFAFPGSRADMLIAAFCLLVVMAGLMSGRLQFDRRMALVLVGMAVAALAMPQELSGVWGMQYRLPVLFVLLATASLVPVVGSVAGSVAGSRWPALLAGGLGLLLLVGHVGTIARSWQLRDAQYSELRTALSVVDRGARLLVFRGADGMALVERGPFFTWSQMAGIAVVERDVFLPFLHKQRMMTVQAGPGTQQIDATQGHPIAMAKLLEGADPATDPALLGNYDGPGHRNYWGGWPRHFDYALEMHFGLRAPTLASLRRVHEGSFFDIHKVLRVP